MSRPDKVILIGGASHVGKSTVAECLARRLDWDCRSTDRLARHPGRPWATGDGDVPPHVRAHYRSLSVDALLGSVLDHYRALWPTVETLIRETIDTPGTKPLVLEGSALLPSSVARLARGAVRAIWLVADDQTIAARIHAQSGYSELAPERAALVETFVALAQRVNALVVHDVAQMDLPHLAVDGSLAVTSFADMCWLRMRPMPRHL